MIDEVLSGSLKNYPHFDAPISRKNIRALVTNTERVSKNTFYPFLMFVDSWQPYRVTKTGKPKKKVRPIRYGARRDAYIFSYYRALISQHYETQLSKLGLSETPIAYRRIPKTNSAGGKCNIDFAKDAFDEIKRQGNCIAIALDVSQYFESLDHERIKSIWCNLMGFERLPEDHYAVYKNITKYHYVDQKDVYRRLGYLGPVKRGNTITEGYTKPFKEMPKQLCSPTEFRQKICGGDPKLPSLVKSNSSGAGVPQGAPISDLIANFYLIDFDQKMKAYVERSGGYYRRYSDDLLLILPVDRTAAFKAVDYVQSEIIKCGSEIEIKKQKTCVVEFIKTKYGFEFEHVFGPQGKHGLEYLGFTFNGQKVLVKDSTISRLYRKVAVGARREARRLVSESEGVTIEILREKFNYSLFSQRFCRVKDFEESMDYKEWTFYSYLRRASAAFGSEGDRILGQISGLREFTRKRVDMYLEESLTKGLGDKKTSI